MVCLLFTTISVAITVMHLQSDENMMPFMQWLEVVRCEPCSQLMAEGDTLRREPTFKGHYYAEQQH